MVNMEFQSHALLACHCSLFFRRGILASKSLSRPPRSILDGKRSFSHVFATCIASEGPNFLIPNLSIYGALGLRVALGHRCRSSRGRRSRQRCRFRCFVAGAGAAGPSGRNVTLHRQILHGQVHLTGCWYISLYPMIFSLSIYE